MELILITGNGCASCISMHEIAIEAAKKFNLPFKEMEVEKAPEYVEKYDIKHVPTLLLIDNLRLIDKVHGFQPKEILELWLEYKIK